MGFKRVRWKQGTVYGIPLADGSFGLCQAIDAMMTNIIYIAVFSYRFESLPEHAPILDKKNILSLGATWRQSLNNGSWAFIGVCDPVLEKSMFPNENFADVGYVGAKHSDAGLYSKFLSACFGITPWNTMSEHDYWEEYLNTKNARPNTIIVLDTEARDSYRRNILGIKDA